MTTAAVTRSVTRGVTRGVTLPAGAGFVPADGTPYLDPEWFGLSYFGDEYFDGEGEI